MVRRLIEADADVDQPYRQPSFSLVGIVHKAPRGTIEFGLVGGFKHRKTIGKP